MLHQFFLWPDTLPDRPVVDAGAAGRFTVKALLLGIFVALLWHYIVGPIVAAWNWEREDREMWMNPNQQPQTVEREQSDVIDIASYAPQSPVGISHHDHDEPFALDHETYQPQRIA